MAEDRPFFIASDLENLVLQTDWKLDIPVVLSPQAVGPTAPFNNNSTTERG
jgi:hypothetical protein